MMFYIFLLICIPLSFQLSGTQSCLRFCKVTLRDGFSNIINENNIILINPQFCTHLVIHAYSESSELNYGMLEKAYKNLQNYDIPPKIKILFSMKESYFQIIESNYSAFGENVLKAFKKFDGCHIDWRDDVLQSRYSQYSMETKRKMFNSYITNLRKTFNDKIITVTVGAQRTSDEYFNYSTFNENADFVALESPQILMDIHSQNFVAARQREQNGEFYFSNDYVKLGHLANKWIKGGYPKSKLLVFAEITWYLEEPRIKTIWSSLNNFAGVFLDKLHDLKSSGKNDYNEMIDSVKKFEKVQVCNFNSNQKASELTLSCYFTMKEDVAFFKNLSDNYYQSCDRIILQKVYMDSNYSIIVHKDNFKKIMEDFRTFNKNSTSLMLSIHVNDTKDLTNKDYAERIASNIIIFINEHNLEGVELIFDDSLNIQLVQEIVSTINKMANIHIGLQINVFKIPEELIPTLNNLTWVTHKINSLSDAALAIYYQWNKLHENYGLNLSKVVIKFSPGIWQQNAAYPFPLSDVKYLEKENPEDDLILNRKYLCLNETIKLNLPSPDKKLNLPMVFTIHEDLEERKKALEPYVNEMWFKYRYFLMGMQYTTDLYYIRYETKETMEYKIKIAAKHGFGGITVDSINNDDNYEICGTSIFNIVTEILKNLKSSKELF